MVQERDWTSDFFWPLLILSYKKQNCLKWCYNYRLNRCHLCSNVYRTDGRDVCEGQFPWSPSVHVAKLVWWSYIGCPVPLLVKHCGKCVNMWRTENVRCFSESVIRNHRGPVWDADTPLTTRIKLTRFPSDMAGNNIQPMIFRDQNRNWASDGVFGCEDSHISPRGKLTYKIPRGI